MSIKVQAVDKSFCNILKTKNDNKEVLDDFSELCDPISQEIRKNEKDPIDIEEDLRFWKEFKNNFILNKKNPTYEDFVDIKKNIIGFPPLTAPGRVRRAYREYMDKLPKNIRDNMQGIFVCAYAEFIRNRNLGSMSWRNIISKMKEHVGEIGDRTITNFDLEMKILSDISSFDDNLREDESIRQIII